MTNIKNPKIERLEEIKAQIEASRHWEQTISFYSRIFVDIRKELVPLGRFCEQYKGILDRIDLDFEFSFKSKTHHSLLIMLSEVIAFLRRQELPKVFLCHASEDAPRIKRIYGKLLKEGLAPWYDKEKLDVGTNWKSEIDKAIEEADFFAIFLSNRSVNKTGFINCEIRAAVNEYARRPYGSTYLLPVRLEECVIPKITIDANTTLQDIQWVDLFSGKSEAFSKFVKSIWNAWFYREYMQ